MKLTLISIGSVLSFNIFASTPVTEVEKIDMVREGNLQQLVIQYFQNHLQEDCDQAVLPKIEILKLTSFSYHENRYAPNSEINNVRYDYDAKYLVTQHCFTGTTYLGAGIDTTKAAIIKGSFNSEYNLIMGGPQKMQDLKIELINVVNPQMLY